MPKILKPVVGPENSEWARRVDAALEAGEKPAYSDIEEGLTHVLNENAVLREYIKQSQKLLTQMVLARHQKKDKLVLNVLDDFIKQYVKLNEIKAPRKPH